MKKLFYLLTSVALVLATIIACEKSAIEIEDLQTIQDEFSETSNKKVVFESPIELYGETHFPSYAVKEHRVVSPYEDNKLTCTAILTKVKGQHYELVTEEYFGTLLYRNVTFDVKITPSGVVSFYWPETWLEFDGTELAPNTMNLLEQFNFHTGCVASGPGINKGTWNYKGYFDGTTFYAKTHFMGKQVIPGFIDYYAGPPLIDGPIRFEFSFELEVVE